jgi:peptide deformylase
MKDPIVQADEPVLRMKAAPVPKKDISSRKIQAVIKKMKKALADEEFGVAIAAPQVGESLRIFVIAGNVFEEEKPGQEDKAEQVSPDRVFINPELTRLSRAKKEMSEGCLSVRGK